MLIITGLAWMADAACLDEPYAKFFPPDSTSGVHVIWSAEPAKQVCARCPVRATCLEYALADVPDHGVFGGLDGEERRALRRDGGQRRRQRPATRRTS